MLFQSEFEINLVDLIRYVFQFINAIFGILQNINKLRNQKSSQSFCSMQSSLSPVQLNIFDMFDENELNYGQRFFNFLPSQSNVQIHMLMDQRQNFKTTDDSESLELKEVFSLLEPKLTSEKFSSDNLHSSTDILSPLQDLDALPQMKKKVKPNAGEEPCCACPKSKCLKLYCVCLQKNNYCGENCSCKGCFNDIWHEEERQQVMETEKFKNLFMGCRCKRSKCQQMYCECFINGKACGVACKCKGCKNGSHNHNHSQSKNTESYPNDNQNSTTMMV